MSNVIMKRYQKGHNYISNLNRRSWDFKPLLEKAKPTSVDSSSDKPKALIRKCCFPTLVIVWHFICTTLPGMAL